MGEGADWEAGEKPGWEWLGEETEVSTQLWQVRGLPIRWFLWKSLRQTQQDVGILLPLNLLLHWEHFVFESWFGEI